MRDSVNKHIPKIFNYIWLGGKIRPDYLEAMEKLTALAERDGFSVNIWVDRSSLEANGEVLKKISNLNIQSTEELLIAMANDPDSPFTEDEKANLIKIILFECLSPANYAAASDFLRIAILIKFGGIYLDTDVHLLDGCDGGLSLDKALMLDEIAKDDGVFHRPGNNNFIISTEGNAKIIDCVREMIRKTTESHSMLESEYNELFNKLKKWDYYTKWPENVSFEDRQNKINEIENLIPGFDLKDPFRQLREFFLSEEAFLMAKKCPLVLEVKEVAIQQNGEGFYCDFTSKSWEMLGISTNSYRDTFTIGIGPGYLERHSPSNECKKKLHNSIIEVFDLSRCDNTWINKTEKTLEQRGELKNKAEKSVQFFLKCINPLGLDDLLKVLAYKGDLHEALSLVKSNANSNELPGGWAQREIVRAEAAEYHSMARGS